MNLTKSIRLYSSLITILLFGITTTVKAQLIEDRIKEIRSMFAEVNNYHSAGKYSNCKKGSKGKEKDIDFEGKNIFLKASRCYYPMGYSKVTSYETGWEWSSNTEYYFKNGKLFFAYAIYNDICDKSEYRFYFDTNGRLIRVLEKIGNCEGNQNNKNEEIRDSKRKIELLETINNGLRSAQSIIL